jgi:predicted ATP-dependent endonuclease of OLD family
MKLSPNDLLEEKRRVEQGNYRQFIRSVHIRQLPGVADQRIEFKYPVTALIAPNGGGKSTVLGATALAYKTTKPAKFFPKAFVGDESMSDWSVEYTLIDKPTRPQGTITRSARFAQSKWRRNDLVDRNVEYVEIQRTVPAGELTAFRRFVGLSDREQIAAQLSAETLQFAGAILDKDISDYRKIRFADDNSHSLLVRQSNQDGYSQFHFGAGEASIISTVERIETAPDNSLILIEEVENGLHPVAVRLLVDYLQNVARRKRHQIIFTTHSQDAIDSLPPESIWSIINGQIVNGALSIESLRAFSGDVPDTRVVFVEDPFAEQWVSNAVHRYGQDFAPATKVHPAGGYPNLINVTRFHNENPSVTTRAVACVDGDILVNNAETVLPDNARFLGDTYPETIIFTYIYENRQALASLLRQRCLLTMFSEDQILAALEGARNSACDPHLLFTEVSNRLDFASTIHIRAGMIDLFNEQNAAFWTDLIEFLQNGTAPLD